MTPTPREANHDASSGSLNGARARGGAAEGTVERHEVDEAPSGPQLRQAELGLLALHATAEDVAVERQRPGELAHPQHDVIDALNHERRLGHPAAPTACRSSCRPGSRGSAWLPRR